MNNKSYHSLNRIRLTVSGIVQGVGFRPFIYNLARKYGLSGFVFNLGGEVLIEIEGADEGLDLFTKSLTSDLPPLAMITNLKTERLTPLNDKSPDFHILPSLHASENYQMVSSDVATCSECLDELFDPTNRRFHYPFINCVNCGPRFTIINQLPYDRPSTSMAEFKMCHLCDDEYKDPNSRRFHAQPNACANCGPSLVYIEIKNGSPLEENDPPKILNKLTEKLMAGEIAAIKSLGGFHLSCNAINFSSVNNLRLRKRRQHKPFAVMMRDLKMVKEHCLLSKQEEEILNRREAPIVLLNKLSSSLIANNVAPANNMLGVMLPYTPLHHLLMRSFNNPLVMTSGNISEEPIVIDNDEALEGLSPIADCFILHDRKILARYDDSVVEVNKSLPRILRRSRGFAPQPIELGFKTKNTTLAFGAQLKSTFCFLQGIHAFLSPHIGDLDNLKAEEYFINTLDKYKDLFHLKEEIIACDLHPDYISTRIAEDSAKTKALPLIRVQHHHAHIAGCMAEHNLKSPVIGIAFDGTGYGTDGTIWGGEFLIADFRQFTRYARLDQSLLPGGDEAIRNPWRMALGYIHGNPLIEPDLSSSYLQDLENFVSRSDIKLLQQQIARKFNSPLTSSCGRLFDAVSSILGVCHYASYEGQAAIELEAIVKQGHNLSAQRNCEFDTYTYSITPLDVKGDTQYNISTHEMLNQILEDKNNKMERGIIALKFHLTLSNIVIDICHRIRCQHSINNVCLSGGVFQNSFLLENIVKELRTKDFAVFFPRKIPANDGGISLGQTLIAAAQTNNLICA